jgi:hypothetical protein
VCGLPYCAEFRDAGIFVVLKRFAASLMLILSWKDFRALFISSAVHNFSTAVLRISVKKIKLH